MTDSIVNFFFFCIISPVQILHLHSTIKAVFLDGNSNADDIARAVEHFALQMYGAKVSCSVHKLRHLTYFKAIGNSNLSTSFKLECLPPTSAALRQHSYRTYHAVQQALGRSLPVLDWGLMNQNDILMPVLTDKPAAPERLLKLV